jgi:hypothetical protein
MKAAPFAYHAPETLAEAIVLLAEHGDEAKVLAGGQSLLPMLAYRLVAPAHLVDIGRVAELAGYAMDDRELRIGAGAPQRQLERSAEVGFAFPVLHEAITNVAHAAIRNRGTVCGSLAHAAPAAELVEGQVLGGYAHGIGNALYEEAAYGPDAQPLATSYLDYALPTATEVPRPELFHIETPSPLNPLGVKGAGEGGLIPVPAAVANAVEDAVRPFGARITRLPVTPSRVIAALRGEPEGVRRACGAQVPLERACGTQARCRECSSPLAEPDI